MRKLITFTQLMFLTLLASQTIAQIKTTKYDLEYNPETSLYDVYLVIVEGESRTKMDRLQMSTQISFVAPRDAKLYVEKTYQPLLNNQNYEGTVAAPWEVESIINAPKVAPDNSYQNVLISGRNALFYNDMSTGDRIKLFSLSVSPMLKCGEDIRLFENISDPQSIDHGMMGADFNNVIHIGGLTQNYIDNSDFEHIDYLTLKSALVDENGNVHTSVENNLNTNVMYKWYGPKGLIKEGEKAPKLDATLLNEGVYKLEVSNAIGCKDEKVLKLRSENTIEAFSASVYPNPARDFVTIDIHNAKSDIEVELFDINGKVAVQKRSFTKKEISNKQVRFSVKELSSGLYNVQITQGDLTSITRKLLVVK